MDSRRLGNGFGTAVILSLLVGTGCAKQPTQPAGVPLGSTFELRAGRSATVAGGLTIGFDRVSSDSRCPMDALCVWVGDATVAVSLSQSGGSRVERELHTADGREVSYSGFTITLVALAPYPRSGLRIRPEDYVATLMVQRG